MSALSQAGESLGQTRGARPTRDRSILDVESGGEVTIRGEGICARARFHRADAGAACAIYVAARHSQGLCRKATIPAPAGLGRGGRVTGQSGRGGRGRVPLTRSAMRNSSISSSRILELTDLAQAKLATDRAGELDRGGVFPSRLRGQPCPDAAHCRNIALTPIALRRPRPEASGGLEGRSRRGGGRA